MQNIIMLITFTTKIRINVVSTNSPDNQFLELLYQYTILRIEILISTHKTLFPFQDVCVKHIEWM